MKMMMMMRRMCAIVPTPHDAVSDLASVVKVLQKKAIKDCHLYLTMGRGIILNRLVQLWQCGRKKKPVEYKLCIKYLEEQGIDTGALSKEFLPNVINDIAKIVSKWKSSTFKTLHSERQL